jgi:hypothetical protein
MSNGGAVASSGVTIFIYFGDPGFERFDSVAGFGGSAAH